MTKEIAFLIFITCHAYMDITCSKNTCQFNRLSCYRFNGEFEKEMNERLKSSMSQLYWMRIATHFHMAVQISFWINKCL
jgi:hypothetical protein